MSYIVRARDRSGNTFGAAKRLERIARFFAVGRKKCAQISKKTGYKGVKRLMLGLPV
jgi:hypothetical protein